MASSMFIPLSRIPSNIEEVRSFVHSACLEFACLAPKVWFHSQMAVPSSLVDGFIMFEGAKPDEQCWVSIGRYTAEVTGDEGRLFLAGVQTRGDWTFASLIAYAFCKFSGQLVFNDAGALDGQESYTVEALRTAVSARIFQAGRAPGIEEQR